MSVYVNDPNRAMPLVQRPQDGESERDSGRSESGQEEPGSAVRAAARAMEAVLSRTGAQAP